MSSEPHPRSEDSGVGDIADERVIEAMLISMAPSEVESQENRIVRALDSIATEPVAAVAAWEPPDLGGLHLRCDLAAAVRDRLAGPADRRAALVFGTAQQTLALPFCREPAPAQKQLLGVCGRVAYGRALAPAWTRQWARHLLAAGAARIVLFHRNEPWRVPTDLSGVVAAAAVAATEI